MSLLPNQYFILMTTPIEVSQRLRQIRKQQKLTLQQVEIRSDGKWKSVVIGSYERGTRSLTISRAKDLCEFYGVPLSALFSNNEKKSTFGEGRGLRIDIRQLRRRLSVNDPLVEQIHTLLTFIASRRDDWNGEIMSLRYQDGEALSLITQKDQNELRQALEIRELLFKERDLA